MAATAFPQFGSLPTEIREMIWKETFTPRIVLLEYFMVEPQKCSWLFSQAPNGGAENDTFFDLDHESEDTQWWRQERLFEGFGSRSTVPARAVYDESYEIVKKYYAKAFGTADVCPLTWLTLTKTLCTWIRDTLRITGGRYGYKLLSEDDLSDDIRKVRSPCIGTVSVSVMLSAAG
jgi:hypothetical protein